MHDTHDVRKSAELEKACEDKRLHDLEMLIDELECRVQRLEERMNMIEFYRRREAWITKSPPPSNRLS